MAYFDKYGVEFSDDRKILVRCPKDLQGEYIVPNGVYNIGPWAFEDCSHLQYITLPCTIWEIGVCAFSGCSSLSSIIIPEQVSSIKSNTFAHCISLKQVILPQHVRCIEPQAFWECSSLVSVNIPNQVLELGFCAFSDCKQLISIVIGSNVKNIGDKAFANCEDLCSVTIPRSVEKIENDIFEGCTSLKSIDVENGNAYYCSFDGILFNKDQTTLIKYPANKLDTFYAVPNCIKRIENNAFFKCRHLNILVIGNSVSIIGDAAFACCENISSIDLPDSVTEIGKEAFGGCYKLKSMSFGQNVVTIGEMAFGNCPKLETIVIPANVKSIAWSAFAWCASLREIVVKGDFVNIEYAAFNGCPNLSSIIVPVGTKEFYQQTEGLKELIDIIQERDYLQETTNDENQEQDNSLHYLFFDTETTGTPRNYKVPVTDSYSWPRLVQLAWIMTDADGNIMKRKSVIVKPEGFSIPADATAVHGITTERAQKEGLPMREVLEEFVTDLSLAEQIVGHNIEFDKNIVGAELYRLGKDYTQLMDKPSTCTMKSSTNYCAIQKENSDAYKWPSLPELYRKLFNRDFADAHDALADITATKECFFELRKRGII